MLYFDYYNHFWTDNLLYGEYKKETIETDSNILSYEELKEKYRMVWLDIILCCVVLSRHNIVKRWLNEMPPDDDIIKVALNACIYGNNKIIILCKKHIPRELGQCHLFYKIFKRGDYATLSSYYELYPDELKNISKIKIGHIIASNNMDIAKIYMDNYDGSIYKDICFADNPHLRIVSTQNKDGCDKSKVRSALLNCTHHIWFFNNTWRYNYKSIKNNFNILKYILLRTPYIDINIIKRLGVIFVGLKNWNKEKIHIYMLIRRLLSYNPDLRNIYGILHINMTKSDYEYVTKRYRPWGDKYKTSIGDLDWCKTLLL